MKLKNIFKNKSSENIDALDGALEDEILEENIEKDADKKVEEEEWEKLDSKLKTVVESGNKLTSKKADDEKSGSVEENNIIFSEEDKPEDNVTESAGEGGEPPAAEDKFEEKPAADEKFENEPAAVESVLVSTKEDEDAEKPVVHQKAIDVYKKTDDLEKDADSENDNVDADEKIEVNVEVKAENNAEKAEDNTSVEDDGKTSSDEKVYKIGEYTFHTFKEYRAAQDDFRKIGIIEEKLDIQDPETALKIYKGIRDGEITFKSPIGDRFKKHISDIVADKSKNFLADKKVEEEVKGKVRWQGYLGLALACAAGVLFVYFGTTQYHEWKTAKRAEEMRAVAQANAKKAEKAEASKSSEDSSGASSEDSAATTDPFAKKPAIDASTLSILPEYQELYNENNDCVGWLEIPEPNKPESPFLAYPVVQTARDARVGDTGNYYYLKKNFDNQDDSNGALFMDYRCDFVNPTTNTIIYGHNMKSGLMFGNLSDYYESKDFYENHKTIYFNTLYEHREYEVIAVCLSEVNYQDESNYRYYNFIDASNMDEWNAFTENVKSLSIYPRDFVVDPGTELLTLSTCDSYKENGRLFIVAKRVT